MSPILLRLFLPASDTTSSQEATEVEEHRIQNQEVHSVRRHKDHIQVVPNQAVAEHRRACNDPGQIQRSRNTKLEFNIII